MAHRTAWLHERNTSSSLPSSRTSVAVSPVFSWLESWSWPGTRAPEAYALHRKGSVPSCRGEKLQIFHRFLFVPTMGQHLIGGNVTALLFLSGMFTINSAHVRFAHNCPAIDARKLVPGDDKGVAANLAAVPMPMMVFPDPHGSTMMPLPPVERPP